MKPNLLHFSASTQQWIQFRDINQKIVWRATMKQKLFTLEFYAKMTLSAGGKIFICNVMKRAQNFDISWLTGDYFSGLNY